MEVPQVKPRMLSRRKFIAAALLATPALAVADAKWIEPTLLNVRHVSLSGPKTGYRCVHFTDIHHKGDSAYLRAVVSRINSLKPDFICFTGDLVENKYFLPETLDILAGLQSPLFGVPGNHEYRSGVSFPAIQEFFATTGGAWLMNQSQELADGKINLIGVTYGHAVPLGRSGAKNILLMHFPAWAKQLGPHRFDLLLAGHSHGGQVRIPLYGSVIVPFEVGEYDMGLFQTPAGPLYVNPGIGYIGNYNFRFNCRPELTVFDV